MEVPKRFGLGSQVVTVGNAAGSGSGCGQMRSGRAGVQGGFLDKVSGEALRVGILWRDGAHKWLWILHLEALGQRRGGDTWEMCIAK